jgi:hypothetical protein
VEAEVEAEEYIFHVDRLRLASDKASQEAKQLLEQAELRANILELPSFEMKASVRIDNQGKPLDGSYTLLWNGPDQWREMIFTFVLLYSASYSSGFLQAVPRTKLRAEPREFSFSDVVRLSLDGRNLPEEVVFKGAFCDASAVP